MLDTMLFFVFTVVFILVAIIVIEKLYEMIALLCEAMCTIIWYSILFTWNHFKSLANKCKR